MKQWLKENDVILRVTSLLIAVFLWMYVMNSDEIEGTLTYSNIPVRLDGVSTLRSNDLVILSGNNSKITVECSGKRKVLQTVYKDYMNIITAKVNVSNITEPGEYELVYDLSKGETDISVVSKNPSQITLVVDRLSTVSVPVEVQLIGTPADGHTISECVPSPDAITVRGPETILRQIEVARVTYDLTGLTSSLQTNVTFTLLDSAGNEVTNAYLAPDTPSTTLDITLKRSNAVSLTVNFNDSPYLTASMIDYTIDPMYYELTGDPEIMRELNQISLGSIDLSDVLEKEPGDELVFERLIILPNGVSAANKDQMQFAKVTVTLKNCGWRTLSLDQDMLPENELFTYPEQRLDIQVFGSNEALDDLADGGLTLEPVYVLDDLVAGQNQLECKVIPADDSVYVKQNVTILVEITQEALDAARNPEPADPNAPQEPGVPAE